MTIMAGSSGSATVTITPTDGFIGDDCFCLPDRN